MKRKITLMSLIVITLMVSSIPAAFAPFVPGKALATKIELYDAAGATSPVTYANGQEYREITDVYDKTDTFRIIANVTSVTELRMYAVGVQYDPAILDVTAFDEDVDGGEVAFFYAVDPQYRDDPNLPGPMASGTIDGWNYEHVTWVLEKPGNNTGSGILAVFDFTVVGWGQTFINITKTGAAISTLANVDDVDMNWNSIEINFNNTGLAPAPYGPTAAIDSIMPPPPRYVGAAITFTGKNTSSEWGFSGLPDLLFYPIVLMEWDFGDGNFSTGLVAVNTYVVDGTFDVNLTVTDSNGGTDWVVTQVTIFPLAEGAVLDVMTQSWRHNPPIATAYNGTGPFMVASPYLANKEELVELYAKVLYNDCPVDEKLVVFTVYKVEPNPPSPLPAAIPIYFETVFTDASGVAMVSYRIPRGEDFRGAYLVYAYCFIAEGLVMDALIYRNEFVNEITSFEALAPGTWGQCETAMFNVTIQSWDFMPLPLIISLTLLDDVNATVGAMVCGPAGRPPQYPAPCDWWSPTRTFYTDGQLATLFAEEYVPPGTAWFVIGATIHDNAYVGVGEAIVSLFDAWPIPDMLVELAGLQGDGQPYCPSESTPFGIECAVPCP